MNGHTQSLSRVRAGYLTLAMCEILFYPELATKIHEVVTGHGWDGSGLRLTQLIVVLPGGLVFMGFAFALCNRVKRRGGRGAALAIVLGIINCVLLAWSIAWYATGVARAGGAS